MEAARKFSLFNSRHNSENVLPAGPSIDPATIVPDLKCLAGGRFYQVQVLRPSHLAKDYISWLQLPSDWLNRNKLP
jgi:hypothetical protein